MYFLKVTTRSKSGNVEARLVNLSDISVVKPAPPDNPTCARTCITLVSEPGFPIWALEDMATIEDAVARSGGQVQN